MIGENFARYAGYAAVSSPAAVIQEKGIKNQYWLLHAELSDSFIAR
jgi:hypothetical protein